VIASVLEIGGLWMLSPLGGGSLEKIACLLNFFKPTREERELELLLYLFQFAQSHSVYVVYDLLCRPGSQLKITPEDSSPSIFEVAVAFCLMTVELLCYYLQPSFLVLEGIGIILCKFPGHKVYSIYLRDIWLS
jgi:hypothetical protein